MTSDSDYPRTARGSNLFDSDTNLIRLLERRSPHVLEAHEGRLSEFGAWAGGPLDEQAEYTDRFAPPRLDAYDIDGNRRGRVILNPDYRACHAEAYRRGAVGLAYQPEGLGPTGAPSHTACFTMGYMLSQADISIHCPVTMTGAVAYVLDRLAPPAVRGRYLPELVRMDGNALSGGTWATELHGGSDVGASTTRAEARNDGFRLHGIKWFTSNAGSGLALATARPDGSESGGRGLGCYLVPSHLDDGTPNHYRTRRLKEKAGTRGLATAELDLEGAFALEVAAPPDGLKAMMAALEYSRIHNAVGSAGLLRRAFLESAGWAGHRTAFGHALRHYPVVQDQLLDMQMELEAATVLSFESVFAFDAHLADPDQGDDWLRLVTALAKYRTAEQAVTACRQAVEMVGGNGYTDEMPTSRFYRDCLVVSVWEGPANIQALELLRLVTGKRAGDQIFLARMGAILADLPSPNREAAADDVTAILEGALEECRAALAFLRRNPGQGPRHGRRLLTLLADTAAASLLCEEAVADLALGDRRKWLVACRFVRKVLGKADPISADIDPANAEFDAVLAYDPVD
ncbi:acyl-CoA dehydrogenase [Niveispirillum sp. SYP-B3756]|uniref:acyl-CoA dehydrogenase family protein n=1 Tax=Niveispirillum sp. SYP-B3756 TaxID=2662178 RepID=UPI001290E76E|nr:acyl-CoA dehydrogenase family protein [Niveispirillum sp. SYP-B3756]MQP64366.1 acyl-CoA dehydrogenase [Niveispirillum sp. SYP-B3756]